MGGPSIVSTTRAFKIIVLKETVTKQRARALVHPQNGRGANAFRAGAPA